MRFKELAETLIDKQIINVQDLEKQLEFFFELWKNSESDNEVLISDISKKRLQIFNEKASLSAKRDNLEFQLKEAKNKINNEEYVDLEWMNRLNYAFRITKRKLANCQDRLSILRTEEKIYNIEKTKTKERELIKKIRELLVDKFGIDQASEIFNEASQTNSSLRV